MEIQNKNKEYTSKGNIVYSCQYHVIFCPKYRRRVLVDDIKVDLEEIILNNQTEYDYKIIEMEIMPDHVHLLIDINPKTGVFSTICKIKGVSSRELRLKYPCLKKRIPTLWTRSEFISSVGSVSLSVVKQYIEDQKER